MIKRFLSLILTVVMLSAFFVIDTSAAIADAKLIYEEDFTRPEDADSTWTPDGWVVDFSGGTAALQYLATARIAEEGYIDLNKGTFDGIPRVTATMPSLPSEFTLTYDVNNYTDANGNWIVCSLNGYNQTATGGGWVEFASETGENTGVTVAAERRIWYTYVFQVSGNRMSVYRKARDVDEEYTVVAENVRMKERAGHVFYAYAHTENSGMYIDNVKIFAGTYVTEQSIETVSNGESKKLSGTMKVSSANANPSSPKAVMALMGIYDERGRIIDMVVESESLKYGDDNVFTLETREYTPEQYEKMIGNTVEMYIWESFETMTPQKTIYKTTIK